MEMFIDLYQDYFRVNTGFMITEGNDHHKDHQEEVDKQNETILLWPSRSWLSQPTS